MNERIQAIAAVLGDTSKKNGATIEVALETIQGWLRTDRLDRQIANLSPSAFQVLTDLIGESGLGHVRKGLLPCLAGWIRDARVISAGCGHAVLRKRVQRLAHAMNSGVVRLGAKPLDDVQTLWAWLDPIKPRLARMTDKQFENLIRFQNSGCRLRSIKARVENLPGDLHIQSKGRIAVQADMTLR